MEVLQQIVTVAGMLISAGTTYYFTKLERRRQYRIDRVNRLKKFISGLTIFGYMQAPEYYEIRALMNDSEKSQVNNITNTINDKYQSQYENEKGTLEIAKTGANPISTVEQLHSMIYATVEKNCLEDLVKLKEIMMLAILREEKRS